MAEFSYRRHTPHQRLEHLIREGAIPSAARGGFSETHPPLNTADRWIENAIGYLSLPIGIAEHFVIDGQPRRIPIAIEESSVIAALSSAAKWIKENGTLETTVLGHEAIGQIQFPRVKDPSRVQAILRERKKELLHAANVCVPGLVRRGGGFTRVDDRILTRPDGEAMWVVHLYCDPCDAMGANLINQACETVAPLLSEWTGETVGLRILSNLVDTRCVMARIHLRGIDPELAVKIEEASLFAELDPYRAATHNKGIMNGVDGVLIATGNDWRAVEAGAHAFAVKDGKYGPLSTWRSIAPGELEGILDLPMAVGTVGGVTRSHPIAAACLQLMDVKNSDELARVIAAVGLTQNLAALRALASNGIVAGHMRLHLENLILNSDVQPDEEQGLRESLHDRLNRQRRLSGEDVRELLEEIRGESKPA